MFTYKPKISESFLFDKRKINNNIEEKAFYLNKFYCLYLTQNIINNLTNMKNNLFLYIIRHQAAIYPKKCLLTNFDNYNVVCRDLNFTLDR